MRNPYNSAYLLKVESGALTLEKLEIGSRPLQALDIHGRLMELITRVHKKVFESLTPAKIIERMRLGKEEKPEENIPPKEEPSETDKKISLKYILRFTKAQFFKSHQTLWNLFEKSDEISLSIEADSKEGVNTNWVRNAVEEPMDEAGGKVDMNIKF